MKHLIIGENNDVPFHISYDDLTPDEKEKIFSIILKYCNAVITPDSGKAKSSQKICIINMAANALINVYVCDRTYIFEISSKELAFPSTMYTLCLLDLSELFFDMLPPILKPRFQSDMNDMFCKLDLPWHMDCGLIISQDLVIDRVSEYQPLLSSDQEYDDDGYKCYDPDYMKVTHIICDLPEDATLEDHINSVLASFTANADKLVKVNGRTVIRTEYVPVKRVYK